MRLPLMECVQVVSARLPRVGQLGAPERDAPALRCRPPSPQAHLSLQGLSGPQPAGLLHPVCLPQEALVWRPPQSHRSGRDTAPPGWALSAPRTRAGPCCSFVTCRGLGASEACSPLGWRGRCEHVPEVGRAPREGWELQRAGAARVTELPGAVGPGLTFQAGQGGMSGAGWEAGGRAGGQSPCVDSAGVGGHSGTPEQRDWGHWPWLCRRQGVWRFGLPDTSPGRPLA